MSLLGSTLTCFVPTKLIVKQGLYPPLLSVCSGGGIVEIVKLLLAHPAINVNKQSEVTYYNFVTFNVVF